MEVGYITADPQIVEKIHTSPDFSLSPLRMASMQHAVGPGIFSTDGARWRQSRLLVQPAFHRTRVEQMLERLVPHVEALMAQIPGDGLTTVNLQPLFFHLTLDTATDFLFGEPAHSLTHYSELGAALDRCARWMARCGRYPKSLLSTRDDRLCQSVEIIEGFANSVIEKAPTTADFNVADTDTDTAAETEIQLQLPPRADAAHRRQTCAPRGTGQRADGRARHDGVAAEQTVVRATSANRALGCAAASTGRGRCHGG